MKVTVSKNPLDKHKTPILLIPLLEGGDAPGKVPGMKGEFKKLYPSYQGYKHAKLALYVGLGKPKDLTLERVRKAFGRAVRAVKEEKAPEFAAYAKIPGMSEHDAVIAITEGLMLGAYTFDKYKTEKTELKHASLICNAKYAKDAEATSIICTNTNLVREWVNENADTMTTTKLAAIATDIAKKNKLKLKILEKKELQKLGMNLILAVGSGSNYPPRMAILEYRGNRFSKDVYAVLGKGVTYDSGGMNLKPTGYLETMKQDMTGAATALGIIKTAAELKLKVNLIAVTPLVENMIGPGSFKPGDVYRSYSGKTVQIGNTDAEGRLILGDAIAYTEKNLKPTRMITLATLTGASFVIFGEYVTSMIGDDTKVMPKLKQAGEDVYERVWELPLYDEYNEELKGDIGDINNLGYNNGRYAGTIMGAAFLYAFVDHTPFTHLDLGNTAFREKAPGDYLPKNATGIGVRLFTKYFQSLPPKG